MDLQRYLILEVIIMRLTPEHALLFLSDALKKLKNSTTNELWEHYRDKLK